MKWNSEMCLLMEGFETEFSRMHKFSDIKIEGTGSMTFIVEA